ncbi:mucin-like protein [Schistosoma japonicum]|nr:mucin-like protein [Schistosoma japonicum]
MLIHKAEVIIVPLSRQARGVCIGVNHLALDSERVRQAELLQKIIQLEKDIQQSDDVKNNTAALRYLETISQLENSFTVLTENVTETSVQLSAPKELKDEVHVKKELSSNVKSCWTYVSQLARLSQVHIRNAAEYHQFHHAVSEVEASLKARVRMTEPRSVRVLPPSLKNCTILANELREHLNHMIHLWGRSGNLLEESRRIVPVHLRLGGVVDGLSTNTESPNPVMARMLTSLTGPNYELKEGEESYILHSRLREKCIESWDLLVERSRERLRSYYARLLNNMAENGDIQYNHKTAMDNFLEDLRGLLLPNDNRTSELGQAMYAFTDRLKMADISRQRSSSHGGINLREQDIVCMHSPLLRLRDHERQLENLRAQSEMIGTHMTNYLREIDADQKRVDNELSLIDQLQHESQSQLDQLISRVKRWSSRFEHEPNVDSSITNSRMSSSLKSSTISDNWTGNVIYPPDTRSPRSIVRGISRLSSSTRSESIPRPVLDAITQIGVTSRTIGTQSSDGIGGETDLLISKGKFTSSTNPERKQVRNAITQIGVSKVDTGTQDDYHTYSPKRSVKEVLCQIGQVTASVSCQTLENYKQQQILKQCTLDAIVQSGVITKNSFTQSEAIKETFVKMDRLESQYAARKYSVLDAICQIGQVTQTTGTQIDAKNTERNKKNFGMQVEIRVSGQHEVRTTEVACQIGTITMNASTETLLMTTRNETLAKTDMRKSDIICQIGKVQTTTSVQTTETENYKTEKRKDAMQQYEIQKSCVSSQVGIATTTKLVQKAVNDVICQVGQVKSEVSTQSIGHTTTKPMCRNIGVDPISLLEKKVTTDVITQTGIVHTSKVTQAELIQEQPVYVKAIETQDVPITSYKDTSDAYQQADLISQMLRKPTTDVVCQVGNVMESTGMQIDEIHKTRISLAGTQSIKTAIHHKEIQADTGFRVESKFIPKAVNDVICQVGQVKSEVSTQSIGHTTTKPMCRNIGVDPISLLEKKVTTDVITQTGIVHTSKVTQAELIQEQPVYVKAIETQDVPITSYKDTSDAYQQADLISQMLRKPTTDVVCQVGNVMESTGMQIDEIHKTRISLAGTQSIKTAIHHKEIQADTGFRVESKFIPKAVNDVICQVGQVKSEVSTQSIGHTTTKPMCRNIGVDPISLLEKKVTTDVITQTGIVHTSKVTQAELMQEQPVYVKAIETQDVPITSYKDTSDAYQQADLISQMLRKPTTDVVCQVGNVMESTGMQIDEIHKTRISLAGTQSIKTAIHHKEIQADTGFRVESKFIPKAVNDVICQVGQVKSEVSTQSIGHTTTKPMCRNIGVDPISLLEKKVTTDVITQTGIVHTSKVTQAELMQEQPVYVKAIETQDVPVSVSKEKLDECQQAEFVKGTIKCSLTDVVCQVGNVFEDSATQTDVEYRKQSFSVGTESMVTSKAELGHQYQTPKSSVSVQVDKTKFIVRRSASCFDLITQCGIVNDTKSTQTTEVIGEIQRAIVKQHFDVVMQTGVMMKTEGTMTKIEAVDETPLITSVGVDPRPGATVRDVGSYKEPQSKDRHSRHVQVDIRPKFKHTDIQTDVRTTETVISSNMIKEKPKTWIDVMTQAGVVTQEVEVQTHKIWKSREMQTSESSPRDEIKLRNQQTYTKIRSKNYDVQTQSGTVNMSQSFQTQLEYRQTAEKRSVGMQNDEYIPIEKNTNHVTQTKESTVQTEQRKIKDQETFTSSKIKTFDVQTQIGRLLKSHAEQTYNEQGPIIEMKELSTQHEKRPEPTVHKKLQAIVQPQTVSTDTQTVEQRLPPPEIPRKTFDVQTQSGSVKVDTNTQTPQERLPVIEMKHAGVYQVPETIQSVHKKLQATVIKPIGQIATQTDFVTQPQIMPMVQTTHHAPQTMETPTQTDRVRSKDQQSFTSFTLKTFDVQTQSGTVKVDSNTQTPQEQRPVIEMKELSTQHEKRPEPTVHKKLQAIVQPQTVSTDTQTVEQRLPPPEIPRKTFDVQTQSGSVKVDSNTQTPQEQRPVIEMKELSTQHEKRPEPTVHKKLQAIVQPQTVSTDTQTVEQRLPPPEIPRKTFDVQTQSGSVKVDSNTQTPQERLPVIEMKHAGVYQVPETIQSVHKKLQATVIKPIGQIATQTDFVTQPQIMPMVQTTHHAPQTMETPTQTDRVRSKDQQSFTSFTLKTFDVQTQSGTVKVDSNTQTPQEQRPVIEMKELSTQHEKRPEPTVHKKLQAIVQSHLLKYHKRARVSQVIEMKELSTQHEKRPEPTVHKKLQAIVQPQTVSTDTQTVEQRLPPPEIPRKTFDVQTQSGSVKVDSNTQTPQERLPVIEMKHAGVYQVPETIQSVHKKLQATVIKPIGQIATQTDFVTQPQIMPMVQTTHHAPQTMETPTQTDRVRSKDQQSFTSFTLKTFDVQTQSGTVKVDSNTQTPQEQRPVIEMKELSTQHEKRPEPTVHKKLQAIVQPQTVSTDTQTVEQRLPPPEIPRKTFDVQTQSGSVKVDSNTQTPQERLPVIEMKHAGVYQVPETIQSVHKKLQATVIKPIGQIATQTDFVTQPQIMPMVQTTHHAPQTMETPTQTDRVRSKDQQSFTSFTLKTFDVQTQSGTVKVDSNTQTPQEQRPVIEMKELSTQHEKRPEPTVHKKLQAIVQPQTVSTDTQTAEQRLPPPEIPRKTFDVQTQSGSVKVDSNTQTPQEQRPVIEMKELSTQHEKRPEPTVHKKLQAIVQPHTVSTDTQTVEQRPPPPPPEIPCKTFDVQIQSGVVKSNSETQTLIETKTISSVMDVGVRHEQYQIHTVNKKLQATITHPSDDACLQTDELLIRDVKPKIQAVSRTPQVEHKQTQAQYTTAAKKLFDIQTQSGTVAKTQWTQTIIQEPRIQDNVDVSVIHTEKSSSLVNKKLQAIIQQPLENISTQTDPITQVHVTPPKTTFDVVTQSGTISCAQAVQTLPEARPTLETADVSVIHTEKSPSMLHRKLQATTRQPHENISTQTDPITQVHVTSRKTTFDVVTQSGTISCAQAVQTLPEANMPITGCCHSVWNHLCAQAVQTLPEARPTLETADVSVIHTEKSPSMLHRKLQATTRQPHENISTQTDPITQVHVTSPKTTFDVVTQSGTISCAQAVQTLPEARPTLETADVSVIHTEKSPSMLHRKLQATTRQPLENISTQTDPITQVHVTSPKTTFDVVTQSGTISCAQAVQTLPEARPTLETADVSVIHTEKSPSMLHRKLQATTRQPLENISTQTDPITQVHVTPPKTTLDVVTQAGTVYLSGGCQAVLLRDTQHEETTKSTVNRDIQVDIRHVMSHRDVQTEESTLIQFMQKHQMDVQVQSGIMCKVQAAQTHQETTTRVGTTEVSVTHKHKIRPINKKLQAIIQPPMEEIYTQTEMEEKLELTTVPKDKYDVQTQSGSVKVDSNTQTPQEQRPVIEMKELSTQHEKRPEPTVHKKLQAIVQPHTVSTDTQTVEQRPPPPPPEIPCKTFDVQIQSGVVKSNSETQTLIETKTISSVMDVGVRHEQYQIHTVNKKLQATITHPSDDACLQTDELLIRDVKPKIQAVSRTPQVEHKQTQAQYTTAAKKLFDIQTQSGTVAKTQWTQTIKQEPRIQDNVDVSVIHTEKSSSLVNKKLQAIIQQPLENISTQTDPITQVHVTPPKTTFDVVTQSGTISCAQAVQTLPEARPTLETADVSVIHTEKSPSMLHRKLQATTRQPHENISTQTDPITQVHVTSPKTTFDVVTQSGTISCAQAVQTLPEARPTLETADVSVIHTEKSPSMLHRKLQAHTTTTREYQQVHVTPPKSTFDVFTQSGTISCASYYLSKTYIGNCRSTSNTRQPHENISTPTDPITQVHVTSPKTTFDVVTQSGTISCAQAVQTLPEARPTLETADVSVIHTEKSPSMLHRKLQATTRQPLENISTQTDPITQVHVTPPKTTLDVVTQAGTVYLSGGCQAVLLRDTQHEETTKSTVNRDIQVDIRHVMSHRDVQTEESTLIQFMQKHQMDVQVQSGIMCKVQAAQTHQETTTRVGTTEVSVTHKHKIRPINKKLQAIIQPPMEEIYTQTEMEEKLELTTVPKDKYDVQTQSGSVKVDSNTQTPQEQRPVIEMKELSTQHEKRPEPTVHKKLQAIVQPHTVSTDTQTVEQRPPPPPPEIPCKTFDVQIQSGVVKSNSETQTLIETKTISSVMDVGVRHEQYQIHTVNKKLQATITHPSDDACLQTDELLIRDVKPKIQAVSRTPQVEHKQTQAQYTTAAKKLFDIQTQSGTVAKTQWTQTIIQEPRIQDNVDVSVIHTEKSSSLVNKKLQAIIQQPLENISTQTDPITQVHVTPPKTTFDVVTQSGTISCAQAVQTLPEARPTLETADVSVIHTEKSPSMLHRKLQATTRQPLENISTQTDPITQVHVTSPKTTFDVVTQSGTISCAQAVQTLPEARPTLETADVSVIHTEKSPSMLHRKLQATTRQPLENISTQTDPITQVHVTSPKTTFDVVTQSGTISCAQAVQTLPEARPTLETADVSVIHTEKSPSMLHRKLQATTRQPLENISTQTDPITQVHVTSPKTTFDVVTQSGTISCAQAVQTLPEARPTLETIDVRVDKVRAVTNLLAKSDFSCQLEPVLNDSWTQSSLNIQCLNDMKDAILDNTIFVGTQTDGKMDVLLYKRDETSKRDVQTESGILFNDSTIQTVDSQATMKTNGHKVDERMSYDVQVQSGIMSDYSSIQTSKFHPSVYVTSSSCLIVDETLIEIATNKRTPHSTALKNKKLQVSPSITDTPAQVETCLNLGSTTIKSTKHTIQTISQFTQTTPSTNYDVQIQSGVIHSTDATQTVDISPVTETKEMSVTHEKEPAVLKGKKLQVRCDSADLGVQTEQITPIIQPTISSTIHTVPITSQFTQTTQKCLTDTFCQATLPSNTYDVQIQSGVIHSSDATQTVDISPVTETKEMSVTHEKEPAVLKGKKLQVRCDSADLGVQTEQITPIIQPTISSTIHTVPITSQFTQTTQKCLTDTFCQATLPSNTYDVQIQSGVIHSSDATQTVDISPVTETKEMSVTHEKEPAVLKGKKLQVRCDSADLGVQTEQITPIIQPTISSTIHTVPITSQFTQTTQKCLTDTFCQATLPSNTYDVQIQSGVIHSSDATQTVDISPVTETKEMSVTHEKEPAVLKGKKLQVRCDSADLGVQTEQITPIIQPTISSTIHTVPITSQFTQTTQKCLTDTFCQATLPSNTYDVQIQSGVIHSSDATQTVDISPVTETKEMSVTHEKEPAVLKGKKLQVRCDSADLGVQTEQITPIIQPTISSTIHTVPITSQFTQTTQKCLTDTFCQATLPSNTYDVQIQSGVIHSSDATQTVDISPVTETKEMSVTHEKEPAVLKGKKLQVRCDSADLGVQTEQITPTIHFDVQSVQTNLVSHADISCQHTELTKPTSTSHAITFEPVSIQTDLPFSPYVRVDQRNKKFQVNLISPSSPKASTNVVSIGTQTLNYEYKDITLNQIDNEIVSPMHFHMIHASVSNVESTSQIIPKIKIDQECQVKITPQQYQKEVQYGSSISPSKDTSSQTMKASELRDSHASSSIGVQVSTWSQETRPSETNIPPQVKNKKLQVYPSKLGEQIEEEFIHSQETLSKDMFTKLTETIQTDECLLKNIKCSKCSSRGCDKKIQSEYITNHKDVQSEDKPMRMKETASSTVKSNYFTRILQMETIPDKLKSTDTSDGLKQYTEHSHRGRSDSKSIQTDTFLLRSIHLPEESRDGESLGKISKKTTIIQLEKSTKDKCVDTMQTKKQLPESHTSYDDIQTFERSVRLQKGVSRSEAQVTDVPQDILFEIRRSTIVDSSGSYSLQQNSVAVSVRPSHMTSPTGSTGRNGKGKTLYQYSKPDVVNWGVQFAPVTLTGVTQTTESLKHKLTIDSTVNIGVQTDASEDDYYIKRVVTTIARKGLSSYCRRGPVARKIEHTDLLTSSLPSNLDEEFDDELTVGPKTTKVTTVQKRGDRRVIREELFTEDYRERGSSLDSRLAHGPPSRETNLQDMDLHEMHEHEADVYSDAEICLQNLLRVWGQQYLLSRLKMLGRSSELSVSLDRSIYSAGKSRLVEAKTQFTSTGNLVSQIKNFENIGIQTSDTLLTTRPPHKNKRIQRGHSFISRGTNQPPPTRSGSAVSPLSPTTEEWTSHHRQQGITSVQTRTSHPFNLATTTFTESTQEQSSFTIEHTVQTYICPTCGSQASIPVTVHSQVQPQILPITQLKDAQSQTQLTGQMTADDNCTYLSTYLSDEEVIRINQFQKIEEDREFSLVTWHPAETTDTERRRDSDRGKQTQDEVWVDSPGKLLELKITGVVVPGTNKFISACEAFYRGLLRVVYWNYEKVGSRQSSIDLAVSIPLADAVISKAVRLATDTTSTGTQPLLDAKIVWRTPEIQRSRYLVHSIRPDAGQNKLNPISLDIASAMRAGLIDKQTGKMLFTHSVYESPLSSDSPISKKEGDSSSDQTERLSIREAIVRGFLVAELIHPESPHITKQSIPYIVPSTSYPHSPTDVDI